MIIHAPKKKTVVEAVCFAVRGPEKDIREFKDWHHERMRATTQEPVTKDGMFDGTWISPIQNGSGGPYWDIRCFTEQAAAEVRAWLGRHGFKQEDFDR